MNEFACAHTCYVRACLHACACACAFVCAAASDRRYFCCRSSEKEVRDRSRGEEGTFWRPFRCMGDRRATKVRFLSFRLPAQSDEASSSLSHRMCHGNIFITLNAHPCERLLLVNIFHRSFAHPMLPFMSAHLLVSMFPSACLFPVNNLLLPLFPCERLADISTRLFRTCTQEPIKHLHSCNCEQKPLLKSEFFCRYAGSVLSLSCQMKHGSSELPTFSSWSLKNGRVVTGPQLTLDDILFENIKSKDRLDNE